MVLIVIVNQWVALDEIQSKEDLCPLSLQANRDTGNTVKLVKIHTVSQDKIVLSANLWTGYLY